MESGGSSDQHHKYTTRAPTSGIVIREGGSSSGATAPTNIPAATNAAGNPNPPPSFKREADQYMPITTIVRIMRRILPTHAKIADDAKETIQECVSEFISFITSEANERCHREYRKTITPEDVLSAMGSLGFDNYVEALIVFLNKYRAQDPERGSLNQLPPFVRSGDGFAHQPAAAAQMAQPSLPMPPNAPPPLLMGYTPATPPTAGYPVDRDDEYVGLLQIMNEFLFDNQGGGEDSSSGAEFDPLRQFK